MTDPVRPTIEEIQRSLTREIQALGLTARKMLLRSMMPTIDIAQQQGVGYEDLTKTLQTAGLLIGPEALRKALFRWRKRPPAPTTETASSSSHPPTIPKPAPALPTGPESKTVSNKADLVRLRTSAKPIDLNALAELGRQK